MKIIENYQNPFRQYDEVVRGDLMNEARQTRLEARGWRVGSTADFLNLTPEQVAFLETKLALSMTLRQRRITKHVTQHLLAKRLRLCRSPVAKMEAGDASVSVDLLLKALFALGAKPKDIGNVLQRHKRATAA